MPVFIAFFTLMAITVATARGRDSLQAKSREDWLLDGMGLFVQGVVIPFLQIAVIYQLYVVLFPKYCDCLIWHPVADFLLSFVAVDYLYYWNHRLLHARQLWPLHWVHHTMTQRHVLGTSRNTLWTSFLILYLWVHALFIYLLQDPTAYVAGVSLTSALDLWRHSDIEPTPGSALHRVLSPWLILPQDHAWHHTSSATHKNYGANFKLWDKIHKTAWECETAPESLGIETHLSLIQKLVWPFYWDKVEG
ncbi:sterol desaturase family protein [Phormidium sp. CCY1219]|uniref:sterol desaturase family protein n=1 Tax=Phormidium sp. CCY1219 TaxID=2886104 RepID=UPI002D1EEB99|nr:sterol desaturase family protein [Phormidium sp. CCY1219]MEB3831428.1 sterol desaturase family protein [Phormidium sp. CCY1219]